MISPPLSREAVLNSSKIRRDNYLLMIAIHPRERCVISQSEFVKVALAEEIRQKI
jgi:hypothetical protein